MSAHRSARDRVRQELTREILEVARSQLAREGAHGLSLRSVARELEMAPSALYRYFASRDDLLSALILQAFESLADDAELASASTDDGEAHLGSTFAGVARSMRSWALAHPHEWALVFGSPVPGYAAPEATVVPYTRLAAAFVQPVVVAHREGRLRLPASPPADPDTLASSLQPVTDGLLRGLPVAIVGRTVQAWSTIIGAISLEIFGHWRNTVLEPAAFFDEVVANLARDLRLAT